MWWEGESYCGERRRRVSKVKRVKSEALDVTEAVTTLRIFVDK